MKLDFEEWVRSQDFPDESKKLIYEAILCYRVGAYRAAFILSYTSFQTIIRHRVLVSEKPETFNKNWEKEKQIVAEDHSWENKVNSFIQQNPGNNIFMIDDKIITEHKVWKERRNACVHAKSRKINYIDVEGFWLFYQNTINKFIINGGKEALLQRIKDHFDPRKTPRDKSLTPVVNDITNVVDEDEIVDFFTAVHNDVNLHFWKEIANHTSSMLSGGFIKFVLSDQSYLNSFIFDFPEKIGYFNQEDPQKIRHFWYEELKECSNLYRRHYWDVVMGLLSNHIIPESEYEDFYVNVFHFATAFTEDILSDQLSLLKRYRFFEFYRKLVITKNIPNKKKDSLFFAHKHANEILRYFQYVGVDYEIVRLLDQITWAYEGPFPEKAREYFDANPDKNEQYLRIVEQECLDIPPWVNEKVKVETPR